MTSPLISVVIPAYNHEQYVGDAVKSVLEQTVSDLELIVVNDGSTDRTGDVVQGYTDPRLRYYYQENQDAYNTINRGISLSEGKYIAILNSDDIYTPDRLERLLKHSQDEEKVCTFSDVIPIDDQNREFTDQEFGWNVWHRKNRDFYFSQNDIYTAFLHGNFMVTTSNLFMTAEAAERVGPFSSLRYLHDYDYIFRMIRIYSQRVSYLHNERLLYYRIHGGNTLSEAAVTGREQDMELISRYMLAVVPEQYRNQVAAGSRRLVDLERELNQVRMQQRPAQPLGVRPALKDLGEALKIWFKKKTGQGPDRAA
ncbi:glycosyltransferase family 2 protein [Thermodesulfobacteriota bacterium]